jgi:hypothetical protein
MLRAVSPGGILPKAKFVTLAQLFAEAVKINDITYIMLKRRDSDGHMPPLNLKRVFCIFAMLDKFLGGDGLLSEKSEFWKTDDSIDEKLREEYATQETSDEILSEIIASTPCIPENRRETWTIIVFSETFFSDNPWDSAEIEKVKKCCRLLTDRHKNAVISANFLHKYEGKSDTPSRQTSMEETFMQTANEYKRKLKENALNNLRFSNCSLIFWNGVSLSSYRKASYKDEDNTLVDEGYGYDFGDWKSYAPPELATASDDHKEFASLFNSGRKQIIASRTCSDVNHTPDLAKSVKLLILTADGSPDATYWQNRLKNAIACVSDADRAGFMIISGIRKNTPQFCFPFFIQHKLLCTMYGYYEGVRDEEVVSCCGCGF